MKKIQVSKIGLLVLLLLAVSIFHQSGVFQIHYLTAVFVSAFLFAYAFFRKPSKTLAGNTKKFNDATKIICVQWIAIWAYNIFLHVSGHGEKTFLKSSMIQMMIPCIVLLGGWGIFRLLGLNTIKYYRYLIFINFLIIGVYNLIKMGPSLFLSGVMTVFTGSSVGNPLESNADFIFSIGLLIILYANEKYFDNVNKKKKIIGLIILVFFCGKRSEALALGALALFSIFTSIIPKKKMYRIERIVSVVMIVSYYFYIFALNSGVLYSFLLSHNINTMGRMKMWSYVLQGIPFSVSHLGRGFSFSTLTVEANKVLTYNDSVYAFHGNVLAFYVDLGFILFGLWMAYNLLVVPVLYHKKFGYRVVNLYWEMTIYLFILYLTESSLNHPITQGFYIAFLLLGILWNQNINSVNLVENLKKKG